MFVEGWRDEVPRTWTSGCVGDDDQGPEDERGYRGDDRNYAVTLRVTASSLRSHAHTPRSDSREKNTRLASLVFEIRFRCFVESR